MHPTVLLAPKRNEGNEMMLIRNRDILLDGNCSTSGIMILNLRQHLRRWTTSIGIGRPIHRNTHAGAEAYKGAAEMMSITIVNSRR